MAVVATNYIEMGVNPVVSFSYRASNYSSPNAPTPGTSLTGHVRISADNGMTWTTIWTFDAGQYAETHDFKSVSVNVSNEFADELCLVEFRFEWIAGDFYLWLDDIAVGTAL